MGTLDQRVVTQLRGIAFIQTEAGYHRPDEVFWDESPFGTYSIRLSQSLREYTALFARVGVKSTPDHQDAVRVLKRSPSTGVTKFWTTASSPSSMRAGPAFRLTS